MPTYRITARDTRTGEAQHSREVLGEAYGRTYYRQQVAERERLHLTLDTACNGLVYVEYRVEEIR